MGQQIKSIITVFLIVSISFFLSSIITALLALKMFKLPEYVPVEKGKTVKKEKTYSYIKNWFHEKQTRKKYSQEGREEKQVKVLNNIKLMGTVVLGKSRYALIKEKNNSLFVKEGEKFGKFTVFKVNKHEILLKDNYGNLYKVPLEALKKSVKSINQKNSNPKNRTSTNHYVLSKTLVEKETADIGNILKDVNIVPVVKNGETIGYKFQYVSPRSILYKYGLRSGDFIVSVNGMEIKTAEDAFKIYNMLRNEKVIRLEIKRRGKRKEIVYEIQ